MIAVVIRRLLPLVVPILLASPLAATDAALAPSASMSRVVTSWDHDWRFSKIGEHDFTTATTDSFDDSAWRVVRVPHDWSTEEPYRPEYASGNGFAAGGIAWYRKHFKLDPAAQGRIVVVEFDGVYANSEIWINSEFAGGRPFGYSSFAIDLTRYLNAPGVDNIIAVRVDHSRLSDSRFYTGSGIKTGDRKSTRLNSSHT